jgi:hypothetical protein
MPEKILKFISRADQLRLRGARNYSRYMKLTKGLIAPDDPERVRWQRESAEEASRDAEWHWRHGGVPAGATLIDFRQSGAQGTPHKRSTEQHVTDSNQHQVLP